MFYNKKIKYEKQGSLFGVLLSDGGAGNGPNGR
jgi:hypothetical protein